MSDVQIKKTDWLGLYFDEPVVQTFGEDVQDYIMDFLILKSRVSSLDTSFFDYSFILLPLCKAFEKHVYVVLFYVGYIRIGEDLKRLGSKMADGKRLKEYMEYLQEYSVLNNKGVELTLKRIEAMADMYNDLRNLPLHVDGKKFSQFKQAEIAGSAIMQQINEFTRKMAWTGVNNNYNQLFNISNPKLAESVQESKEFLRKNYPYLDV